MVKLTKQPMRAIIALVAVIFASMQIYFMSTCFESDVLFFERGAIGPTVLYYAADVVIVIALVIGIIQNEKMNKRSYFEIVQTRNGFTLYFGILSGFLLLTADWFHIKNVFSSTTVASTTTEIIASYVGSFLALFSIPAALYFLYLAFVRVKNDSITLALGVCVIVWALLYVMHIYFNLDSALRSPVRILNQLAPLTIMIYFVYDLRQRIKAPKPALQFAFGFVAVLIIALNVSAELYLFFTKVTYAGEKFVFTLAELSIGVFIVSGLRFDVPKLEILDGEGELAPANGEDIVAHAPDAVPNENTGLPNGETEDTEDTEEADKSVEAENSEE